ncbi:MAG: type II toxin-antitoxin system RelE/ParE family toxin [Chloroflexi bacterium]|nr:type II toxin-antitoxin system RelE/ParE family toxin [Chloroflexota bacterium]
MPYLVELQRSAERDLLRLSPTLRARVLDRVGMLAAEPRPAGSLRLAGVSGAFRLRVGDHRVVYEVDDQAQVVVVTRVRHRREVYRDLR